MPSQVDIKLEAVIKRDRLIVIFALTFVIALSWVYILSGAGMDMSALDMTRMSQSGMAMMMPAVWSPEYVVLMFFMWWVMMIAMMLPSAAPMILLFAALNRKEHEGGRPHVATSIFTFGYLAGWAGFSLIAVVLQWAFELTGILSPTLVSANITFGAILLIAAGAYQLTPLKHACLRHCRSPANFLSRHWRRGTDGALQMGLVHGAYCVGCCWFLMGLLFFGGVMNLYWIVGIALLVILEKLVPAGHWLGYAAGVALLGWGAATFALLP